MHIFSILFGLTLSFLSLNAFAEQVCTSYDEMGQTHTTCHEVDSCQNKPGFCKMNGSCVEIVIPETGIYSEDDGDCLPGVVMKGRVAPSNQTGSPGGNSGGAGNDINFCTNLRTQLAACRTNQESAKKVCDEEKDDGYTGAIEQANTISASVNTLSGGALTASCNKLLQLTQATTSALGIYEGNCRDARNTCLTSCESLYKKISKENCGGSESDYNQAIKFYSDNKSVCEEELKVKQSQAGANAQRLMGLAQQTKMCKQQFAALPGFDAGNGILDCNNPALASNRICKCRNPANASDPDCGGTVAGSGTGLASLGSSGDSAYSNGSGVDISKMGISSSAGPIGIDDKGQNNNENVGGKKGNGVNLGSSSGGNGGGASGSGGGGAGGYNTNVNGGYGRGGGGGAFGSSSRGGGGGAGGYAGAGQPGLPNLNKFRPNMAYQPGGRNLAGVSGPDGIMGPHADLWLQVKNRYNYKNQQGQFLAP